MENTFNEALKGGEPSDVLSKLLPATTGGAKKRPRRQTRKPRRVRVPRRRPAATRRKPRRAKSSRRRSRRGGIWSTLPAVALLAANEGMKRKSGSNLYASTRRWGK